MTITEPRTETDNNPLMTRTDRRTVGRATAKEAGARAKQAAVAAEKDEKLAGLDVEDKSLDVEEKRQRVERRKRQLAREEKARVRKEAVQKWKGRGRALVHALPVIVAVSAVAALIVASVWIAWPAQAEAMREDLGARSWVVPGVVEGLTWTSASLTILAVRRKAPAGRYRVMTAISALIAASLNLLHSPSASAGQVNALASLAGVLAFELVVGLLQHTQSGRTAAEVREQFARWVAHPLVSLTAWRIRAPYRKTITVQKAWDQAWESHHGGQPGTTAARVRRQRRAEARMELARSQAGRRRVRELKRSLEATVAEAAIAESSAEAAQARADEMQARAREFRDRAEKEEFKAQARLSSQQYRGLPWIGGRWVPVLSPQPRSEADEERSEGAKIQFPSGESAPRPPARNGSEQGARNAPAPARNAAQPSGGNDSKPGTERDLSEHLHKAFPAARELAYEAAADRRKRTGNGFFSPYTLASRIGVRRQDGPALVALLEEQPGFAEAMAEEIEKARAAQDDTRNETEMEPTA
ncbi:uncharacterized protein DUF2637 [Streptomyces sp. KhCrAH-43]|uniref:DUF2637 domain-containing protein n=1 Tax=unclassified Streptomyces TaxID=2593676 RepID=UPI0003A0146F|nr:MULTISPECIES: DUF2637 domain-containing protein [unclassified Streptomyces]MYS37586.1 DUF2637 domain-containing protein [Streptomyces sp. SID4920]MYX67188.1 DUF2637 domain-containing protein [Streptomyces sp. SID8373]RAJ44944.1 uncharacterized protein DUF2637 [Streptomyces sp. KhCrAH-43]